MNDKHMKETICLVKKEISRKAERKHIPFWQFLKIQMRFVGWKIWTLQAIILGAIYFCMAEFFGKYYMENPGRLLKLLMVLAIVVLMTAIPFVYRSIRYRMQEIEAVTYVSSLRLLVARLLIVAVGDGVLLVNIYVIACVNSVLSNMIIFLCLSIPFLTVCNGCLFMVGHLKPKHFLQGSMGLCTAMIGVFLYKGLWLEKLFQDRLYGLLISVALVLLCIYQIWKMHNSSYVELQII